MESGDRACRSGWATKTPSRGSRTYQSIGLPVWPGLRSLSSPLPANHVRTWIPGGYLGTAATISKMRDLVTQGKRDFRVRKALGRIVRGCPSKDYHCYAKAIHAFCRDEIRYVFDPQNVELVESPWSILESGIADCDSICVLAAALYEQAGFPTRFVTIKADGKKPDTFSHVFVEVKVPGKGWMGSDCTQPGRDFGWSPPASYPRKEWPGSKDPKEDHEGDEMAGLRDYIPGRQYARGYQAGSEWNFREEPDSLVEVSQDDLEVAPLHEGKAPSLALESDFFFASQAPEKFRSVEDKNLSGLGDVGIEIKSAKGKLYLGLALIGLGLLSFWRR